MSKIAIWYRGLSRWGKFATALAPIATLFGILWGIFGPKPTPPTPNPSPVTQTETRQDSKVQSSPNATVIQSGRDTIINNPPPKVEVKPEPKTEARPPGQANLTPVPRANAVQTMVNSPGGIQALGNVTISSDRRLIHSLVLKVVMELETTELPVTQPGEPTMNLAFGPALGVFTKSKMLYRFASEGQFKSEQIEPTVRRYTFSYKPESEEQLLGKPIDVLAEIEQLGINAKGFLEMVSSSPSFPNAQPQPLGKAGAVLSFTLFVNGVPATNIKGQVKPTGALTLGEMSMNVAQAFSAIPSAYGSVASR